MSSDKVQHFAPESIYYTSDSRLAQKGSIFVALKGATHDGHAFVEKALNEGASVVVQADLFKNLEWQKRFPSKILIVDNSHSAHRELAQRFRQQFKGKLVAIGGSNGKTTTKEFCFQILSRKFKCIRTEKSQNGELGIPKTLEQLRPEIEIALVEVGIDGPGDMIRHCQIIQPDYSILTSIGEEHLNLLKDIETVFAEESILFTETWKRGGTCLAPENDPWLKQLAAKGPIALSRDEIKNYQSELLHVFARQNASLAIRLAELLGLSLSEIQSGLRSLQLPEGRGREIKVSENFYIFADHYNANLSSMKASIEHCQARAKYLGLPLAAAFGDMFDLGDESKKVHQAFLREVQKVKFQSLIMVGAEMTALAGQMDPAKVQAFPNAAVAATSIQKIIVPPLYLLVKGSRGMAMEKILERFTAL